jgi:phosphatidylserine/phosphatidylglycerophosphate/cardiolipin synthase-like enzyme
MANGGVDGSFKISDDSSPAGFTIEIYEIGLFGKRFLGTADTNANGEFSVRYFPSPFDRHLVIELYDNVHRLIDESEEIGVNVPVLSVLIQKLNINANGWLVTLDSIGPLWLTTGNQVTLLTDNALAWGQFTTDVTAADDVVHMAQLQFELDYMFTKFVPDPPQMSVPTDGERLEVELEDAAARGAEVQVLMNDFYVGYPADMVDRVKKYFTDTDVEVRGFKRILIEGAMHAKIAVIDEATAYTIGSGLIQEYFDGEKHFIDDPRRGEMTWPGNQMRVPIHDLSAKIVGPAARDFDSLFSMLWTRQPLPVLPPVIPPPTSHAVQLVVTLPGSAVPDFPDGATGILEAYQRAIRYAEDVIYIENQYFTDEAIVESLTRALKLKPSLQIILLLNPKVDLPFYGREWWHPLKWQDDALGRLINLPPDQSSRIGVFMLWGHEISAAGSRMIRNYVHSKVGIVDDKWATVGSANLDGVSLSTSHYAGLYRLSPAARFLLKKKDLKRMRAIEANVVFYNGVDHQPASNLPDLMRRTLWAEHLGYANPNHPDLTTRPAGGWLSLWENVAARRKAALNASPPTLDAARILRGPFYVPDKGRERGMSSEETYLFRCGVDPNRHKVEDEIRSFDFSSGTWL